MCLWPCLNPERRPTSLTRGSFFLSALGATFCSRDQMMVSSITEARVGFWGRERYVGSVAVAAGKAAGGSVVSAMPWLDLLIALRSDQIQTDPLPSALSRGRLERFGRRLP